MVGAWSLMRDPHFHSPPSALHSLPSLYGISSHVGSMPECFSEAEKENRYTFCKYLNDL